jgi:hypothetical protein
MSDAAGAPRAWPEELRLRDRGAVLTVSFDNGERHDLPAEYLRVESPSAEVKGHGAGQEVTVPGKRNVTIPESSRWAIMLFAWSFPTVIRPGFIPGIIWPNSVGSGSACGRPIWRTWRSRD